MAFSARLHGGPLDGTFVPMEDEVQDLVIQHGTSWLLYRHRYLKDGSLTGLRVGSTYAVSSPKTDAAEVEYGYAKTISRQDALNRIKSAHGSGGS